MTEFVLKIPKVLIDEKKSYEIDRCSICEKSLHDDGLIGDVAILIFREFYIVGTLILCQECFLEYLRAEEHRGVVF